MQVKVISASKARGVTNRFILENLRDGFCAGRPTYALVQTEPVWVVPISLSVGQASPFVAGEVIVQALDGEIIGFTPVAEIMRNARAAVA